MIELTLLTTSREQELIKHFLEENASEELAKKINNGVQITIDGQELISLKTLDSFMKYATEEARKLAGTNPNSACIEDKVVFGWAMHYFEEDSIIGTLYNLDGIEYKKKVRAKPAQTSRTTKPVTVTKPAEEYCQCSVFDLINTSNTELPQTETDTTIDITSFDISEEEIIKTTNTPEYDNIEYIEDVADDYSMKVIESLFGEHIMRC